MKKSIKDFDLNNKKVIIRCDFNVPIKDGIITDDTRIKKSIPTIKYAIDNNAKVILMSHLGRVKDEADLKKNDLSIILDTLSKYLEKDVIFISETRGKTLEDAINKMNNGDVLLMQNTRYEDLFGKKESSNDKKLGAYWAGLGDIFINDAFGTLHREHASNVGIAKNIPSGVGLLVEEELNKLSILDNPEKPFVVILGGAKISDKIGVVKTLLEKCDYLLIGGGMAHTFLKAENINIGSSILDEESINFAKEMLGKARDKIILPQDVKVTTKFDNETKSRITDINNIKDNEIGLDIGPKTIELFKKYLKDAKTIFWNGTLGYSEFSNYKDGTEKIMNYLKEIDAKTVLGGGDTVAAATKFGVVNDVTHASTGGGATLEYIENKSLPGLVEINNK